MIGQNTHRRIVRAIAHAEEQKNNQEEKVSVLEEKQSEGALWGLKVSLSEKEREALSKLTLPSTEDFLWAADEPAALDDLRRVFAILIAEETDQNNVDVVRAKAAIAAALCRFVEDEQAIVEEKKKKNSLIMWVVFGALSTFWVARDSVSVVMGIRDILPLGLLSPVPFAIISIIAVTITTALLYFMELQFFRMAMEVESIDLDTAKLEADRKKMESVQKMNAVLMENSLPNLSGTQFSALARFAGLLNKDAEKEKSKYSQPYPETPLQSWSWFAVRVFGVTVGLFSDFFTYHSILVFLAPALVGTPAGIAILGISMLVSLCIYGALYQKSFIRSLVPHFNEYEENQKTAKGFSAYSEHELLRSYDKECWYQEGEKAHAIKKVSSAPDLHATTIKVRVDRQRFLRPLIVTQPIHQVEAGPDHESAQFGFRY